MDQEFGQIDIQDTPQHQDVLRLLRIAKLQIAGGDQHGLDRSHSVIVMMLAAELLRAKLVGGDDFHGQRSAVVEAVRVQSVLRDERVIGHHHGHRAEERLQVVRQLGSAGVARIHRDEDRAGGIEIDLGALEYHFLGAGVDRALNCQNLLCDDRQDLQIDAIEFVEAGPGAARGEAFEEFPERDVVEALRAVEHHALLRHGLREILRGLRLAGTGWSFGRAPEMKAQGAEESAIAAIRQRCDHQT